MSDTPSATDINFDRARAQALKLLARREHAPMELMRKLRQRGYEQDIVERVIDELTAENFLSVERYAENVAYSRAQRGQGPNRIYAELAAVNVDGELIETVLSRLDIDWTASAQTVRQKRFGNEHPTDHAARAKQMRFLQQRGFTSDQIKFAMLETSDDR